MARGLLQVEEKTAVSTMEIVIPVAVKSSLVEGRGVTYFVSRVCAEMVSHEAFGACLSY
jgi:hypothetical protein